MARLLVRELKVVLIVFRERNRPKLGVILAVMKNLLPLDTDALLYDFGQSVLDGGGQTREVAFLGASDLESLLNDVVAVWVLDKVGQFV